MSKKKETSSGPCNCLELAQTELKPHGIALETELFINFTTGKTGVRGPLLRVKKLSDSPKKTTLRTVLCTYCPFCGKKAAQ